MKKQNTIRIAKALALALTLTALPAFAGDGTTTNTNPDPKDLHQSIFSQNIKTDTRYFRDNEWSVDVFGAYAAAKSGVINSGGGGGIGVNYFFNRFVGVGIDGVGFDGGSTVDTVGMGTANLIGRLPIESIHLAPYIFGGVGGADMTGDAEAVGDAGIGVEWRATPNWGVFVDGRYVACADTNDFGLLRLGVRCAF